MGGTDQAIEHGLQTGDWTPYVWVCGFIIVGVLIRYMLRRQDESDKFQRGEMANVIDDNTAAWGHVCVLFRTRPCLTDSDVARLAIHDLTEEQLEQMPDTAKRAIERRKQRAEKATE